MPELTSPIWLLALLPLLPLIWWLHRFRQRGPRRLVSALFLWQELESASRRGERLERADPLWLLRAAIASLLLLALAAPFWSSPGQQTVTVWFDASLSMQAEEAGETRLQRGVTALLDAMDQAGVAQAQVRLLQHPGNGIRLNKADRKQWPQHLQALLQLLPAPRQRPLPPLPLPAGVHWLVSDGADRRLQQWVETARIGRVIQVGEMSENSAITGLSLRRSLQRTESAEGLIQVINSGRQAQQRTLQLWQNDTLLQSWTLTLAAGAKARRAFSLTPAGDTRVEARLLPPAAKAQDPLPQDDSLSLRLDSDDWRYPLALEKSCGEALDSALQALPGTRITTADDDQARLVIGCGPQFPQGSQNLIWFRPQPQPRALPDPPLWHTTTAPDALTLEPETLYSELPSPPANGDLLLSAGDVPLILRRQGPGLQLEVRLALDPALTRHPSFPILLAELLRLAGSPALLQRIWQQERAAAESRIGPNPVPATTGTDGRQRTPDAVHPISSSPSAPGAGGPGSDLRPWLILLAALLLLYDIIQGQPVRGAERK